MQIRYLTMQAVLVLIFAFVIILYSGSRAYSRTSSEHYYNAAKADLLTFKTKWSKKYRSETSRTKKESLLSQVGELLSRKISGSMLSPWYGTKWAYHGTSVTPGKGSIACGYFVTTVLRDSGVNINRVRMAQAASETMIKKVNGDKNIKRYRNKSIQHFVAQVKKWGEGLYIVGLDYHTGFILNKRNKIYFIHSSFYAPSKVVSELALTSQALKESKYRVLGKLFVDDSSVRRWLLN